MRFHLFDRGRFFLRFFFLLDNFAVFVDLISRVNSPPEFAELSVTRATSVIIFVVFRKRFELVLNG